MQAFRANPTEPSPVIWNHWRPVCVSNEGKEGYISKMTLLQAATIARQSDAFFFRKIGLESKLKWPGKFKYDGSTKSAAPVWKRATAAKMCKPIEPSGGFPKWSVVEMCPQEPVVALRKGSKTGNRTPSKNVDRKAVISSVRISCECRGSSTVEHRPSRPRDQMVTSLMPVVAGSSPAYDDFFGEKKYSL
jgi:hypothetical protein